jgi:perosamine synthetase
MSMFSLKSTFGQHNIYKIDESKHAFLEYFKELYQCDNLQQLHLKSQSALTMENLSDVETDLHKIFYKDIKGNATFKQLYCDLIKNIYDNLLPDEEIYIYQSFPSIRIQYFNSIVVPPHYDSDHLGNHPIGEKNFILPITKMYGTNRVFIESEPGKKDFQGIDLDYGDLLHFNGNKCTHYNEQNVEKDIRISLDFRIILLKDYKAYMNNTDVTYTNPRDDRIPVKMTIGGYYQMCFKNNLNNIYNNWFNIKDKIVQTRPNFDINEANACFEYMKSGDNFVTEFKQTAQLEKMITEFTGSKYCVMTTSGTTALMLAYYSLNVGKGDDVIVPNYTMIASINSIKAVGANPIIVDVDPVTCTLTKEIIEKHITDKTKAILHVSLNNRTNNLNEIVQYCKENNLFLVEDAAQSVGCFLNNKHIGTYGTIGCFSLSTPKIISTGQGGFLVMDSEDLYKKLNMIKNYGRKEGGSEVYEIFGLNSKFTDIQAVIGIEQMKKLPYRIKRMREIFDLYYNELISIKSNCKMIPPANDEWIPWFIDIFVDNRDDLASFLNKHNIQTRITYPALNKLPMHLNNDILENSNYISMHGLFLPSHTLLTDHEIKYICEIIKLYYA